MGDIDYRDDPSLELTEPEYTGPMTDPILLVLNRHQWVGVGDFEGMCLCGETGRTTHHGYRLHVRGELLGALSGEGE